MNRLVLFASIFFLPVSGPRESCAVGPSTNVVAQDKVVHLETRVEAPFTREEVWQVLRDYENLAGCMPHLDSSRVVSYADSLTVVRQVVTSRLLLPWTFRFTFEYAQVSTEKLQFHMIEGNMQSFEGHFEVKSGENGAQIGYHAKVRRTKSYAFL